MAAHAPTRGELPCAVCLPHFAGAHAGSRHPGAQSFVLARCTLAVPPRGPADTFGGLQVQVETGQCYERTNIRKWFYMGGDTCPLTGVRLRSTEVRPHCVGQRL